MRRRGRAPRATGRARGRRAGGDAAGPALREQLAGGARILALEGHGDLTPEEIAKRAQAFLAQMGASQL